MQEAENQLICWLFRFLSMLRCLPHIHSKLNSASKNGKHICIVKFGQKIMFIVTDYEQSMLNIFFKIQQSVKEELFY